MSKSTRGIRVAGIASLAVSLSVGVAAPAFAAPGFEFTRIKGDDRYGTAVAAAEVYGASDSVILANGQPGEYADALAGNYLAGAEDAPILLTKRSGIPSVTKAQIDDIDPDTIFVVGGESAVPADQVAELEADGYNVERVSGSDRFGTNAAVIAKGADSTDGVGLIATGLNFPDALAAGPFAYQGHSLGLVRTNSVPDAVGDALEADGVTQVLIFGGTGAVGAGVVSDLAERGITVLQRFSGGDRSETSELAAEWALDNLDFSDEHVGVASGYTDGFGADALAGGPVEGNENSPMLITRNVNDPDDVLDYLEAHSDTLGDGHIYGGSAAISDAAEAAMENAAQGDDDGNPPPPGGPGNQDFQVSPTGDQLNDPGSDDIARFTYTFSGLPATVDAALIPCWFADTDGDNNVVFADDPINQDGTFDPDDDDNRMLEADTLGDTYSGDSFFVFANGELDRSAALTYLDDIRTDNGVLELEVFGIEGDCFIPLVFDDAAADDTLVLDANDMPVTPFAVGGEGVATRGEAPSGAAIDGEVIYVNKAENFFVMNHQGGEDADDAFIYRYGDTGDTYNYEGGAQLIADDEFDIPLAEFEEYLSVSDYITAADDQEYSRTGTNEFEIDNDFSNKPTNAVATTGDFDDNPNDSAGNDVKVTWNAPSPTDGLIIDYAVDVYEANGSNWDYLTTLFDSEEDPFETGLGDDTNNDNIDDDVDRQVIDEDRGEGTFKYVVTAITGTGDTSLYSSNPSNAVTPQAVAGAPRSTSANAITGDGVLNTGDVLTFTFNEDMQAADAGDSITMTDAGGTVVRVSNGLNATFSVSGNTLTVTLTNNPTVVVTGDNGQGNYPLTVVDSSGVTDLDGINWDEANSPDNTLG